MKAKLMGSLGVFGAILWYIISFILTVIPLFVLGFPWWVSMLILIAILVIPVFGEWAHFALWVWSFIVAVKSPISTVIIIYYIALAIYGITILLPAILGLFLRNKDA